MEICRRHVEIVRVRSISPASNAMAGLAIALIQGFTAREIGRIFLCGEERRGASKRPMSPMFRVMWNANVIVREMVCIMASSSVCRSIPSARKGCRMHGCRLRTFLALFKVEGDVRAVTQLFEREPLQRMFMKIHFPSALLEDEPVPFFRE